MPFIGVQADLFVNDTILRILFENACGKSCQARLSPKTGFIVALDMGRADEGMLDQRFENATRLH